MAKAKTRIKKNYVCTWTGTRGGQNEKKFFTKQARDDFAAGQKAAGFKHVKTRRQTALKPNVVM
jgi:uncharacterized membrane protein